MSLVDLRGHRCPKNDLGALDILGALDEVGVPYSFR